MAGIWNVVINVYLLHMYEVLCPEIALSETEGQLCWPSDVFSEVMGKLG